MGRTRSVHDRASTIQKRESQSHQHGMGAECSAGTDPTSEVPEKQTRELDADEFVLQCWARNPDARRRRETEETVFRQGI